MQLNLNLRSIIAVAGGPMANVIGGIANAPDNALSKLFSFAANQGIAQAQSGSPMRPPSGLPTPFQLPSEILQNPMGALGSVFGSNGPASILAKLLEMLQQGGAQSRLTSFNPFQGSSQFFPEMGEARFNRGIQGGTTIMGPDPLDGVWTPPAGSNITLADVAPTTAGAPGAQGGASLPQSRMEALGNQFSSFMNGAGQEQQLRLQNLMQMMQQMMQIMSNISKRHADTQNEMIRHIRG